MSHLESLIVESWQKRDVRYKKRFEAAYLRVYTID